MADNKKTRYDKKKKTMWIYREFEEPKTLVPSEELKDWVDLKQRGTSDDDEPIETVNYVFPDEKTAEYNHQPLSYSGLGNYVGDLDDNEKYDSGDDDLDFETRKDFGIE